MSNLNHNIVRKVVCSFLLYCKWHQCFRADSEIIWGRQWKALCKTRIHSYSIHNIRYNLQGWKTYDTYFMLVNWTMISETFYTHYSNYVDKCSSQVISLMFYILKNNTSALSTPLYLFLFLVCILKVGYDCVLFIVVMLMDASFSIISIDFRSFVMDALWNLRDIKVLKLGNVSN